MTRSIAVLGLVLVYACVNGCTSTIPINPGDPQELATKVRPGDTVALVTRAGVRAELLVTAVDATSITGNGVRYPLDDLQSLQVEKVDSTKVGIIGAIGLYVLAAVLIIAALISRIPPGMPG